MELHALVRSLKGNQTLHKFTFLICVDINECIEETDDCAQNCINTNGSYICSCNTGYYIDIDGRSCNGTDLVDLVAY